MYIRQSAHIRGKERTYGVYTVSYYIPVWVLFIVTAVVFSIAVELGFRAGRLKSEQLEKEHNPQMNTILGTSLGLLAFLLAFTFNMAGSRYDARKQLVLDEATAIETAYLRAQVLPAPPEGFRFIARFYGPNQSILDGSHKMPAPVKSGAAR